MAHLSDYCPAHIEYTLIAEMLEEHSGHRRPIIARTPIKIRPPPTPLIIDSALHHREVRRMIQSHRLNRPNNNHFNLLQKTKQVFQLSTKVPYYLFNIQVDYPTTIQLNSLSPIPFLLRIGPAREGDVNAPPTVFANSLTTNTLPFHLIGIKLKIKAFTVITLLQHREKSPDHEQTIGELTARWNPDTTPNDPKTKPAPIIPDFSDQNENQQNPPPMLDIGELLDIRFGSREANLMGKPCKLDGPLYPDFVTYNILHRHVLRWEVTITVARESFTIFHEAAIVVIPSCSWS